MRTVLAAALLTGLLVVGAGGSDRAAAQEDPDGPPAGGRPAVADGTALPPATSVVLANVGNVSPHCAEQVFKLCLLPVEERVAAGLARLDPELVGLVLPATGGGVAAAALLAGRRREGRSR